LNHSEYNAFFLINAPPSLKVFNNTMRKLLSPNDFPANLPTLFGIYSRNDTLNFPVISNEVRDLISPNCITTG